MSVRLRLVIAALLASSFFLGGEVSFLRAETARESAGGPAPVQLDANGDKWAQKTLKKLTLEEKIGQMLIVRSGMRLSDAEESQHQRVRELVRRYHIGAVGLTVPVQAGIPVKAMPREVAVTTNRLQKASEVPLLIAADLEYGLSMRVEGATPFPYPMAFGAVRDLGQVEAYGRIVAQEARSVGIQWNWFPTADVNSNPQNPIINTRSFGEDPEQVGELLSAYIRGAHQGGMLTTAKHFPGHGDTATDTHLGMASVEGDIARLERVELPPFRDAIAAGVDAVMTAHVTVPSIDPDAGQVASTSKRVVTDLLRKKMDFLGLIVTDSLEMNGLTRLYGTGPEGGAAEAAIAAVKAGNDMLLFPPDLDSVYRGLLRAVRAGEIPETQIDASVLKILRAKASLGLHRVRMVNNDRWSQVLARPAAVALAHRVAQDAVTMVRNRGDLLPLLVSGKKEIASRMPALEERSRREVMAVVFTDDLRNEAGRVFVEELRSRIPEAKAFYVDPQTAGPLMEEILSAAKQAQVVLAPVYVAPVSGKTVTVESQTRNTVSLTGDASLLMKRLTESAGDRTIVIALGNPYLAADFPDVGIYLCTFSSLPASEVAAVRALFAEAPMRGRLPVTIPGVAQRGNGLDWPPVLSTSKE